MALNEKLLQHLRKPRQNLTEWFDTLTELKYQFGEGPQFVAQAREFLSTKCRIKIESDKPLGRGVQEIILDIMNFLTTETQGRVAQVIR